MAHAAPHSESDRLATELAALKHFSSQREAVEYALKLALAVERQQPSRDGMADDILAIARRCAPQFDGTLTSTNHADGLFDENGLPARRSGAMRAH